MRKMNELNSMKKLVRRWRARAEDCGPLAACAYLDAANDLESEIKKSAQLVVPVDGAGPSDIESPAADGRAATEL
jgi:hypothetical protein